MRQITACLASCLLLTAVATEVGAQTWCSTNWPTAVFCDDFDGYVDGDAFNHAWPALGPCSSVLTLDTDFVSSEPLSAKMNTQENGDLGYSFNAISDVIRNAFGPTCPGSVSGTDLNPLVLELVMNGQTDKARFDTSFFTMGAGFATAPTNWAWSEFCGCSSPDPRYPIICQQETPGAACPPISGASAVPVIAVGFLPYLDNNPCRCGSSPNSPVNEHLSFFDGLTWYRLRQGLFPGSGDFRVRSGENRMKLTIKLTTIKVELTCPATSEYSWCEITGGYTGPFSGLATGFPLACELKADTWVCKNDPSCNRTVGVPGGGVPRYDNIVLHGGICSGSTGACCFANTSCTQAYAGDCQTLGGQFAGGGTTCSNTACCPPLAADHDMDGDVDMADFGWFQGCMSGTDISPDTVPCECNDFDHDDDVDGVDFTKFLNCMLGADIAANPACLN